jgi:thymidylate kinase
MYAKMLCAHFNNIKFDNRVWIHEHEPTFTSEEADKLNFDKNDAWQREFYFMKDRMNHQAILKSNNVVLDRYVLTGLAYAQTFSPKVVEMMISTYKLQSEFIYPDVVFFIDMDPINALAINDSRKGTPEYNPKLTLDVLQSIRDGFITHMKTISDMDIPVITIQPFFGDIDKTFTSILNWFDKYPLV